MTGRTKDRLVGALVLVALAAAAEPALVQLGWHLRLLAGRAGFPLDLEWMEGGMLVHAQRIAAGQGIYVKPSLDFVPYLYTPLYPALFALLSFVFPLGYLLGRVGSLLALFAALVLLGVLVAGEARGLARGRRLLAALVGLVAPRPSRRLLPSLAVSSIWCVQTACCWPWKHWPCGWSCAGILGRVRRLRGW